MKITKKFKTSMCLIFSVLILGGIAAFAAYNNSGNVTEKAPENIREIAVNTLTDYKQEIMDIVLEQQGIQCDPSKLTLGESFNINYVVGPKEIAKRTSDNFNQYLSASEEWLFLVMYEGKAVTTIVAEPNQFVYFGKNSFDFFNALNKITSNSDKAEVKLAADQSNFYFVSMNGDMIAIAPNPETLRAKNKEYGTVMKSDKLCKITREHIVDNSNLPVAERIVGSFSLFDFYWAER